MTNQMDYHYHYTTLVGFFKQDEPTSDPNILDYATTELGLIDRPYDTDASLESNHGHTNWQRFERLVREYARAAPSHVKYKVIYMARHGQGVHNLAEAHYGSPLWDAHWSLLDGDPSLGLTWFDAKLTAQGIAEAQKANDFWPHAFKISKIPFPEKLYCSPMTRCLETSQITWRNVQLPPATPKTEVKELLREVLGEHTCDRRSTKSQIQESFPDVQFEEGFEEEDPLWTVERETDDQFDGRTKLFFDELFEKTNDLFIATSGHSGQTNSAMRVLGHRKFKLLTRQIIPVFVKAERVDGPDPRIQDATLYRSIPAYLSSRGPSNR